MPKHYKYSCFLAKRYTKYQAKLLGIAVVGGNKAKHTLRVPVFMATSCTASLKRDEHWKSSLVRFAKSI